MGLKGPVNTRPVHVYLAAGQRVGLRDCRGGVCPCGAVHWELRAVAGRHISLVCCSSLHPAARNYARSSSYLLACCGIHARESQSHILAYSTRPLVQLGFVASFTSKLSDTVSSEIGKVCGGGWGGGLSV